MCSGYLAVLAVPDESCPLVKLLGINDTSTVEGLLRATTVRGLVCFPLSNAIDTTCLR
jgi:hypothetical protein